MQREDNAPTRPLTPGGDWQGIDAGVGGTAGWLQPLDPRAVREVLAWSALLTPVAIIVLAVWMPFSLWSRVAMVGVGLGVSAITGLAARRAQPHWQAATLLGCMVLVTATIFAVAAISGVGIHSLSIGLAPLLIALTGALIGTPAALLLAALTASGVLGVAFWGTRLDVSGFAGEANWLGQRIFTALFLTACGAAGAAVLGTTLRRGIRSRLRRERMYRDLFARSTNAMVLHRDFRVVLANEAAARLFGVDTPELLRGADLAAFHRVPEMTQLRRQAAAASRPDPVPQVPATEATLHRPDGGTSIVTVTTAPVRLEDGPALESLYLDVGALREAHDERERNERLMSRLIEFNRDAIALIRSASGQLLMVNPAFERLTGYRQQDALGLSLGELSLWPSSEVAERFHAELAADRVDDMAVVWQHRSGRPLAIRLSAARFADDEADGLAVVTGRDVTTAERTRLEYEAILQTASIGIAYMRDRRVVHSNRACEAMFGWGPGELVGRDSRALWSSDAEHAAIGALYGPRLAEGEAIDDERLMARRDGSRFMCRIQGRAIDRGQPGDGGTIWLFEDVTERHRSARVLAQAKEAAESATRAKSAFLANVSHEIRTPLNALIGLLQLMARGDIDSTQRRAYVQQMIDSAEGLSAIVSDVLDLSKIEAGGLRMERTVFDLRATLEATRSAWATLADSHGLEFELDAPLQGPTWVLGDPLRLRQVLNNYLANALKFTQRGSVRLVVRMLDARRWRFEVQDTGMGIEPEKQVHLFQPFTQADESTTRRYGGTGLGLSLCRELAHLMGGGVGLSSEPGVGSTFWAEVELPPGEAPAEEAHDPDDDLLQGLRVLVAEDNPVNMLITTAMLEHWGVTVGQVANGKEAVDAALRAAGGDDAYDLVLMDLQMPVLDGYQATRALRQHFTADELPVIALTAAAIAGEKAQVEAAGMNAFLTKPLSADQLRETLVKWRHRVA